MTIKCTVLFLLLINILHAADPQPNHLIFDGLLKKNVKNNSVDYKNFLLDRVVLQVYLKQFETVIIKKLNRNEKLALYINAYNAFTIDLILENYNKPIKSIKDISSPWDTKFCNIGGVKITLNEVENKFLREEFNEPRIHFAINCASISCPPLQPFAYLPDKIDDQLTEATTNFMRNPLGVIILNHKLEVSQIFDWYKADFQTKESNLISFIFKYLSKEQKENLPELNKITLGYQKYNWNLNDIKQ
jgi:hypothetical protein